MTSDQSPPVRDPYSDSIRQFAAKSKSPYVRDSEKMVEYFLEMDRTTGSSHSWMYMNLDAFNERLKQLKEKASIEDLNQLYWQDTIHNIEAYDLMVVWRGAELLHSAINSLNRGEILPPAIIGRSLLELASVVLIESNNILGVSSGMYGSLGVNPRVVAISQDLEETIVKLIHGTRLPGQPADLKQKNVLTYIDTVSKHPDSRWLRELYDFLCEIAHPNVVGNARYWSTIESVGPDGSQKVRMERNSMQQSTEAILEKVLWAIGWSAAIIRNGRKLNHASVEIMTRMFLPEQSSIEVLNQAIALFSSLQAQGVREFAKWYDGTKGATGLKQGDFEPRISLSGIGLFFKKKADFEELTRVIQEHGLGIVRIGPTIHEITSPEKMQEVASSYGAQGVIVSVQRHLVEVVDPNWKGVLRLVEDIGRRVFGAKVDEDRAPAEAQ